LNELKEIIAMNIFCKINNVIRTTSSLLVLLIVSSGYAQQQTQKSQSPVQLADQYFAAGEYYTAAHLYGQYLNPSKEQQSMVSDFPLNIKNRRAAISNSFSRTDILFKQAESYRLANYWQEAAAIYKECMEDPEKYDEALYWYAVCERSLGHYTSAKESLEQYLNNAYGNNKHKEAAKKELQTLIFIQQQLARPDSFLFTTKKLEIPYSHEKGAFAPIQLSGNQFLISSTEADPIQVNGINPYRSRLFIGSVNNNNLEAITPVIIPDSDPMANQGAATISPDGKYLYFSQWKKENGHTVSSIYYSEKQTDGWSAPKQLSSIHINGHNSKQPFCSTDGKYLFFASDNPGGMGGFDIWYAPLNEDGTTGVPLNAGAMINTKDDEQAPFYHNSSNTLVFSSNGRPGMGGYDLFAAKGKESSWKIPENMGHPVNSQKDDIYFFASEQTSLLSNAFLSSDRGEGCCLETYNIIKAPKDKRLTGKLLDCIENTPVGGAEIILKDAAGKIWRTTTDADGMYSFETGRETYNGLVLTANKELYLEATASLKTKNIDETDLMIDKLTNEDMCIEKKPEEKPIEPEPLVIKAEDVVTVFFDFDRSLLKAEAVHKLDSIYTVMKEYPASTIQISGYTDGLGSDKYNAKLSDRRARACASYLIKKGIEKERVSFVSFGECCPVEMEIIDGRDNPDGRSKNRRALINIKKD